MVKFENLFPSLTGWTRVWLNFSKHMATLTCLNGPNLEWYTLCYYFIYCIYIYFIYYFIYYLFQSTVVIDYTLSLWRPITRKIRVAQKNVIEEKLLEIKRSIRRDIYLFQIRTGISLDNYQSMLAMQYLFYHCLLPTRFKIFLYIVKKPMINILFYTFIYTIGPVFKIFYCNIGIPLL